MSKKILAFYGSYRPNSNSSAFLDKIAESITSPDVVFEKIKLAEQNLKPCMGCFACRPDKFCCIQDDMPANLEKILAADVVILSIPVFMFQAAGLVKIFMDRLYPFLMGVNGDYTSRLNKKPIITVFSQGNPFAETFKDSLEVINSSLNMIGFQVIEQVVCGMANEPGAIYANEELMNKAAEIGKRLSE